MCWKEQAVGNGPEITCNNPLEPCGYRLLGPPQCRPPDRREVQPNTPSCPPQLSLKSGLDRPTSERHAALEIATHQTSNSTRITPPRFPEKINPASLSAADLRLLFSSRSCDRDSPSFTSFLPPASRPITLHQESAGDLEPSRCCARWHYSYFIQNAAGRCVSKSGFTVCTAIPSP